MNKKILASIFVIGMLALAMGYGTYSYFSDTEKAQISFKTGTMNLQLATGTRGGSTGEWEDEDILEITGPTNWDEDEEYTVVIWFTNAGDIGAKFLYREYFDFIGEEGFKEAVELVSVYEYYNSAWDNTNWVRGSTDGTYTDWGWWYTSADYGHGDRDHTFTLYELLNMKHGKYDEKCYHYASGATEDYLPPGGFVAVEYTFKLMGSKTTPEMMGQTFSFKIECHMTNENIATYPGPV